MYTRSLSRSALSLGVSGEVLGERGELSFMT
jgi:hypothetical protein